MSFQWSISTDRLFRRCQRQFFFREIAANHAARDWRREAFILKQLKTLELWRGTVIGRHLPYGAALLANTNGVHAIASGSEAVR
jgi:hypothetical protein